MKLRLLFILLFTISIMSPTSSQEIDCNQFDKLTKKYVECTAKKIKNKTSDEVSKGKKKIKESKFKKKISKFIKSKTLTDLIKN